MATKLEKLKTNTLLENYMLKKGTHLTQQLK